jgi:dTDP-4-amino-4,6-dideoxygalactose transaminase
MVPFNKPYAAPRGWDYMREAIACAHISGDGSFTKRCHAILEEILQVPKVLLTTSCTHALELAALLLDLQPGDEVILPAFTFVSTANAFALRGVRPVFADIRPDTLNLDESRLADLIGPRTRAVVVVHYAGVGCEMKAIRELTAPRSIAVVEDNAHGLFGSYAGKPLGTFGALATLSFHETKNISCGEGGALVINDARFIERAEILREKGTNRSRFFRGQVDKYTWIDIGSSYLPSDLLAAFLLAQLEERASIQARRQRAWSYYQQQLSGWAQKHAVQLPHVPAHCEHPAHLFYLLLPDLTRRQAMIAHLKARDVQATFHYQPLHLSAMGTAFGGKPGDCPVTESVCDRLIRLPFYVELEETDQARVVEAVRSFTA